VNSLFVLDVETYQRGFVISRQALFLRPWMIAQGHFPAQAQELVSMAGVAVPRFADFATVDLAASVLQGGEPAPAGDAPLRRVARAWTGCAARSRRLRSHWKPHGVMDTMLTGPQTDDVALMLVRTRTLSSDQVVTWDIPADPAYVSRARTLAGEQLEAWGLAESSFVTELVVSELVTNAIRYGSPPIHLRLIRDATLICEVSDGSSTAPHMRRARIFDEGGRGLLLVAQLTQRWGTRHSTAGKTIWYEQTLPATEQGH
jgi:anti-sigma regulatory factor (Ser/Thr protein kinase)